MLQPDPGQVHAINEEIERRLIGAFEHLVVEVLQQPAPAKWGTGPAAHALQAQLREAAIAGDLPTIATLCQTHAQVLQGKVDPARGLVVPWAPARLSASEQGLLQSAFADDIGLTTSLLPPAPEGAARMAEDIDRLLARLDVALPDWAAEFRALVSMILLARTGAGDFAGASSFAAWGAILVNPLAQHDDLALMLTLIHESSHLKLFSAYLDDEIVLNDPAKTYSSPLRREGRPMNGLYHAAFVLARMVLFLHDLRQSGEASALLGDKAAALDAALGRSCQQFAAAHGVIAAHGQLTPLGQSIMDRAAAAVAAIQSGRVPA